MRAAFLILVLAILNIADYHTTIAAIEGLEGVEGNPISAWLIRKNALWFVKLVVLPAVSMYAVYKNRKLVELCGRKAKKNG